MSATIRLSGYPAAAPVSLQVAGVNAVGTGPLSVAKSATPGAAAGAAPALWGSIAHGAELSAAALDVSAWTLDGATEAALDAAAPYTAPRRVTGDQVWHRKNTTTAALTVGVGYPFAAIVKPGTSNAARIVIREAGGGEARVLTTGFAAVTVAYSAAAPGTITGAAVEVLADGFVRLSGVFTPGIATTYSFGVGPNPASGVSGNVDVYGGALAEPEASPPPPEPEPETVPTPFAPEQWELLDAGTNGTTLIVRILELPYDGGRPLTFIGYRLNGSDASIGFPAIAPGDYQITVPSLTEASVLLRAANALGGVSSDPKVATPTAAGAPDPGPAAALTYANDIWEGKAALSVPSGQIISLGGVTLATSGETYINGVRLFNGDGSQWHVRRWGDLQYVPNGAHDALNAGEFTDVSVTWRRTGDVSDRTFTIRVYGSTHTGNDLARGVTASTAMTLTQTVAAGEVLEVAFTAGASACTPSLGGVAGASCPAGKRDVQYLRAPSGGSAALTFTTAPSNVIARVVNTPGGAASIRRIKASRSGSTLSLDWRTMPRSGFPNTSGWTEGGGTPAAPEVRNRALSAAGFQTATGSWTQWKFFNAATTRAFLHDAVITGVNSVAKLRKGFTNFLMYDVEGYGPVHSSSTNPGRGNLLNPLENVSTWPDSGVLQVYDTIFDRKETVFTGGGATNNEALDGDAYIRNMLIKLYFMNGDWKNTGDAISDMKGAAQFHCMTYGASWRGIRAWHHATLYGRTRLNGPYSQAVLNQSERGGIIALWMVDQPGGLRVRDQAEVPTTTGLSAFNYVADKRQTIVMKSKPAFAPECDYAATDFEFEQSLNGGASWSPLSVERTGPNDCWGATRRTITGVSASITHVRARARWGAKVGAWTQAGVTV